jgi:AcrR family transcriptional regulator
MPDAEDTIRQQLAEARRGQILDAATQVFAAKGFARATTREIAAAARVSEGTLYNYFTGKADLLAALVVRLARMQELSNDLEDALQEDPTDFFVRVVGERLSGIDRDQRLFQIVISELLVNDELRGSFRQRVLSEGIRPMERYLRARMARGEFREIDIPVTVRAVQSMFIGLVVLRVLGDPEIIGAWERLPEAIANLFFRGVIAHAGEQPGAIPPGTSAEA